MSRPKTAPATVTSPPLDITPGRTEAWAVLGYLGYVIRNHGCITVDDWNSAVRAGDEFGDRTRSLAS